MEFYDNYGPIGDLNDDYIQDNLSINDGYESPYSFNFYDNYNKCISDFTLHELQNIQKKKLLE